MTLENNPEAQAPEEQPKTYGSTEGDLRQAAKEMQDREPEVTEVLADDDVGHDLTAREAGKELSKYRDRVTEEKEAVRVAMQPEPEPSESEKITSRLDALEHSRSTSDAEIALQQGQQQLAAAHQAQAEVDGYRRQLVDHFEREYGIPFSQDPNELGDYIKILAEHDQAKAVEAVQYIQQADAAVRTQYEAVAGRQSLAHQAIATWGAEDRQFAEAHKDIYANPAAHAKLAEAAREVLREAGLSDEQITEGWNGGQLRSAQAQHILLMAARQHLGAKNFKKATPKIPKVVRPGVGGSTEVHGVRAAEKRFAETGNPRDAARLYSLRKAK